MPSHDLIITATALANGCALLTENVKEFKIVPGLEVLTNH
jgi:predicted nucleic acid-binding protein